MVGQRQEWCHKTKVGRRAVKLLMATAKFTEKQVRMLLILFMQIYAIKQPQVN